jgi:hypothetical protein
MKKLSSSILIAVVLALFVTSMALAAFTNGGFESGDLTGWTEDASLKTAGITVGPPAYYNTTAGPSNDLTYAVGAGADANVGISTTYSGSYAAVINYEGDWYNLNTLSQSAAVDDTTDLKADGNYHYYVAFAPVLDTGGHSAEDQPFVNVSMKNGSTEIFNQFSYPADGNPNWIHDGAVGSADDAYHMPWQVYDIAFPSGVLVDGDTLSLAVTSAGCNQSGHWGYTYLDDFGPNDPATSCHAPSLHVVGPATGIDTGGTLITITGEYLDTADSVKVGSLIFTSGNFTIVDPNTITVTTSAHIAGVVDVTVFNECGAGFLAQSFEFVHNTPPTATDDLSYSTNHVTPLTVPASGVLANDSDGGDGGTLTVTSYTQPAHGTVVVNSDGSFTYTPDDDFVGQVCFDYTVSDGIDTDTAQVCIELTNEPPVAEGRWTYMMQYDPPVTANMLDNDYDPDGDPITVGALGSGPWAAQFFEYFDDGEFTYQPEADFCGIDYWWYNAMDNHDDYSNEAFEAFLIFAPISENHITLNYNGWQGYYSKDASDGTYRMNNEKGGAWVFAPNYKYKAVTLYTYRGPDQGQMAIYLDGKLIKVVNLYRATPQWGYAIPLSFLNGKHTLRVENVGVPKGKFITFDYLKVNTNTGKFTIEDTSPQITWGVDLWKSYYNAEALDGSYRKSTKAKARFDHDFYGERVDWIAVTGPDLGIAKVIIDGTVVDMVDLYSPTYEYMVIYTYSGLDWDFHRIRIESTGTRSGASSNYFITVDGFGSYTFYETCNVFAASSLEGCTQTLTVPPASK